METLKEQKKLAEYEVLLISTRAKVARELNKYRIKPVSEDNPFLDHILMADIGEHNLWSYEVYKNDTKSGNPEVINLEKALRPFSEWCESNCRYIGE